MELEVNGLAGATAVEKKIAELTNGAEEAPFSPDSPALGVSGAKPLVNGEARDGSSSEDSFASSSEANDQTPGITEQEGGCVDRVPPETKLESEEKPVYGQLAETATLLVSRK